MTIGYVYFVKIGVTAQARCWRKSYTKCCLEFQWDNKLMEFSDSRMDYRDQCMQK